MKFNRIMAGWYESENREYKISKYLDLWEVYERNEEGNRLDKWEYVGYKHSLKEAKELCK